MALNIGELVGLIRADDTGMRQGLASAALRMRGLQRDVNGRLRDMNGRFVAAGNSMGRSLGNGLGRGARAAASAVKAVAPALLGIGVGVPAVAAATAALGGLAAGAVSAGLAVQAFKLAAQPQLDAVADSTAAAEAAEKAHEKATLKKAQAQKLAAKGGDEYKAALREAEAATKAAKEADAAYEQQLAGLPPATQAYAKELRGLKDDHQKWSDSMAGTTMPVFTKGIQILRDLLPMLTPFVKAAASAFSGFLDDVGKGVKSAGFKEWADDMANAAGPALSNFLAVIKNLAIGFGGLLQAFASSSDGTTGGLVRMTEAFAKWATGLKDSAGFEKFLELVREGKETLGTLASAALQVFSALSPMLGLTVLIAVEMAKLINKIPPDVLTAIAAGFVAISLAVKAYTLYTRIAAAVTRAWAVAQGLFNTVMMMNPVGLVIAAIVGLVAIIVIAYKKSETFRDIVKAVWAAVRSAISSAIDGIKVAINWFSELPGKISKWFGQAKDWAIQKFTEMVTWVKGLPGRVSSALSGLLGALKNRAISAGSALVSATRQKLSDAVNWVKGLPGRAKNALGNLGNILSAAGRSLIQGFINGIRNMIGSVKDAASSVVSAARDFFPFSPAKEGPFSGKGYTLHSGRALAEDFGRGITDELPYLRRVMDSLPAPTMPDMPVPALGAGSGSQAWARPAPPQRIVLEVRPGAGGRVEALLTHIIRDTVAVKGGGDVQKTFGRRR